MRNDLQEAVKESGAPVRVLAAGDFLDLGRGLALQVIHPPRDRAGPGNEGSLVLRLAWHDRGLALLPGDLDRAGIGYLLASGRDLTAEVLVLPHHGSKSSRSPELYDRVAPRLALASAERLGRWDMPAPAVVEDLARRGCRVLSTGENGQITVRWAGPEERAEATAMR